MEKELAVMVTAEDVVPVIATIQDMVDSAFILGF
jgi:hypothetical protein